MDIKTCLLIVYLATVPHVQSLFMKELKDMNITILPEEELVTTKKETVYATEQGVLGVELSQQPLADEEESFFGNEDEKSGEEGIENILLKEKEKMISFYKEWKQNYTALEQHLIQTKANVTKSDSSTPANGKFAEKRVKSCFGDLSCTDDFEIEDSLKEFQTLSEKMTNSQFLLARDDKMSLENIFLKNLDKLFLETDPDIGQMKSSDQIAKFILRELKYRELICKAITTKDEKERERLKKEKDIKDFLKQEFAFIDRYKSQQKEIDRFREMLGSLKGTELTDAEKIAINAYTRRSDVNKLLVDLDQKNGALYFPDQQQGKSNTLPEKEMKKLVVKRQILMTHALLLQHTLSKIGGTPTTHLVRIDTALGDKDPYKEFNKLTFNRFTSTMKTDDVPVGEIERKIDMFVKLTKAPRIKINFLEVSTGVDITPWAAEYVLDQREVLFPVGSEFTIEKTRASPDIQFQYNFKDIYSSF